MLNTVGSKTALYLHIQEELLKDIAEAQAIAQAGAAAVSTADSAGAYAADPRAMPHEQMRVISSGHTPAVSSLLALPIAKKCCPDVTCANTFLMDHVIQGLVAAAAQHAGTDALSMTASLSCKLVPTAYPAPTLMMQDIASMLTSAHDTHVSLYYIPGPYPLYWYHSA